MTRKTAVKILIVILVVVLFAGGVFYFGPYYQRWQISHSYQKFEKGFLGALSEDTYGGATPHETYEMFISALKNGDLSAAGQYFYWEYQKTQQEKFEKMRDEGKLEQYIADLPEWEEMTEEEYWDPDGRRYTYKFFSEKEEIIYDPIFEKEIMFPAGEGRATITFQLNKQAEIWKIYSL